MNLSAEVIVIGAGISGLLAARVVQEAGYRVLIFDKGRGVGGRMATRRIHGSVFDHGAPYFTVRDPEFKGLVASWENSGVVRCWSRGFSLADGQRKIDGQERYCGVAGMSSISKYLARDLEVQVATKVVQLEVVESGWHVIQEDGSVATAQALILTAPWPQSLELLATGQIGLPESSLSVLQSIEFAPCLALLVRLSGSSLIPEPGGLWLTGEPLAWIADNQRKGISPGPQGALTLHAGPEYSRRHWQSSEQEITQQLLDAAGPWLGSEPLEVQLHRWRYSRPLSTYPERCLSLQEPAKFVLAGDAFGGSRVEGAALSGLAAGRAVNRLLKVF